MTSNDKTAPAGDGEGVDRKLPLGRCGALSLQHVLVMYAGTVAVPLIVGGALGLSKADIAFLINADLFAAGIATLVQAIGFWRFGIRMPVMMGVTFAAVGPMIAIGIDPALGLPAIYGATIVAGVFGMLVAPLMGRVLGVFPPLVTGTVITLIGVSLMGVAIHWAAGGQPTTTRMVGGVAHAVANPAYGEPVNLAIAAAVLAVIIAITRFGKGLIANIAVLLGIVFGVGLSLALGRIHFDGLAEASWVAVTTPFHFGMPRFELTAIASMCIVMLITLVESTGMFLALGEITGRKVGTEALTRGLRADGLGTVIGGMFNTFPYTSFSQNVGLVTVTGVRSRYVAAGGGLLLVALALFPKVAHIVASVPQFVLGGAGIVMFGMVAATGVRILGTVDHSRDRHALYVIAISIGLGLVPTLSPQFFQHFPAWTHPLTHSGIVLGTCAAVLLNLFYNGVLSKERSFTLAARTSHGTE
ncbi:nucleobase:cation symporter-2 family protein [Variovorax sp. J22G73]|uniref:nucleobase:cation symporter-2 family protein n=1 Tax=unclassified Variovorax TaxID=663243 RepID=UPI002574A06F|nr:MULTISPECIES: nucleobase:cation symporter-2 family protein [unclassified Variovorax]MDM0004599.1 nucleobase:cation symporter-2 family protein [Variovorax sp. J22R203]MDM0095735.1 nucleobase:cation symporter-2 family protein [Variovorax sp. J22G73]